VSYLDELVDERGLEGVLKADGFDDCVVGIVTDNSPPRLVYCKHSMVLSLVRTDGMSYDDAEEYLAFNTWCAYVGEQTPIFIDRVDFIAGGYHER
jgi:hypothetical protein